MTLLRMKIIFTLLKLLKIPYTKEFVKNELLSHPEYPSLLSFVDVLTTFKIGNKAVKITEKELTKLPLPTICQVHIEGQSLFYILTSITNESVMYYDEDNTKRTVSISEFLKIWTGICLVIEKNSASEEPHIKEKIKAKRTKQMLIGISILSVGVMIAISIFSTISLQKLVPVVLYSFLICVGLVTAGFLLWYRVDTYNPKLQSFCTGGSQKINCNAVLNSKYANFFGVSISTIAFAFFFSSFAILLLFNFSVATLSFLSYVSFVSIPVLILSIYYQAFVIKNWCKFCLLIQGVLLSTIVVSLIFKLYEEGFDFMIFMTFICVFSLALVGWLALEPILLSNQKLNLYIRSYRKVKSNPNVFFGLLQKSEKIQTPVNGVGIELCHRSAKYKVLKVCNPYCGPCAKAHPLLDDLYEKGIIDLQIIFTSSSHKEDLKYLPVNHLVNVYKQQPEAITSALNDWYTAKEKNYEEFVNKYPIKLSQYDHEIDKMHDWCNQEQVAFTPSIYINGYRLPSEYTVTDLKEVLI